eukprot:TRINITY_DN94426_c0_g1_i1.p1 TRINITY_DN94426_c0_g1~~TRINITY_DN94426_c0_g1_i1.p1  ORF type:complete len:167 (-),score=27.88 TRINITY_DN94426_c0_g1_i1:27-527(-)
MSMFGDFSLTNIMFGFFASSSVISIAASIFLIAISPTLSYQRKIPEPLLPTASAMSLAASDSPSARIIAAFFSSSFFITMNFDLPGIVFSDSPLCVLLCHLLAFDGLGELVAEAQVCYGNIVEKDVEVSRTVDQHLLDFRRDLLSLGQQLVSIVLCNDCLEYLVAD